jgi:sporulation protein YlmC with PRC-barrel domain
MLKNLMTATAMVALLTTGALAQNNTPAPAVPNAMAPSAGTPMLTTGYTPAADDNLASHLIGAPVYASSDPDADKIGDINDLVVNDDGTVAALVVGVGGFLGVGEKNVAIDYDNVDQQMDENNNPRLIVNATKEALDAAPAFDWDGTQTANAAPVNNNMNPAPVDNTNMAANTPAANTAPATPNAMAPADNNTNMAANAPAANATPTNPNAMAPADNTNMAANTQADNTAPAAPNAMAPADNTNVAATDPNATNTGVLPYNSDQLKDVTLTAEELIGTNAYGLDDQHLGAIGDVVLGDDGKSVQAVVIDFGGFLGIGTKPVAVDVSNLRVAQDQNGNDYVYMNVTRDQLDKAVAFNSDTFKTERDQQLLQTEPLT